MQMSREHEQEMEKLGPLLRDKTDMLMCAHNTDQIVTYTLSSYGTDT